MQKIILKIRNKSESERKKIALIATIICGVVLVAFWITTLKGQFKTKSEDAAPFNMIKDSLDTAIQDVTSGVKNIKQ